MWMYPDPPQSTHHVRIRQIEFVWVLTTTT